MLRKIKVPRGKELHSLVGNYQYKGPCVVKIHRGSRFPETFTDGTKWYYVGEEPKKEEAVVEKEVEPEKPEPKKRKRKTKVKLEENLDGTTNEPVPSEREPSRFKHKESDDGDSKRDEAI